MMSYFRTSILGFINVIHDWLVDNEVARSGKESLWIDSGLNECLETV